jgi:hypothetical protein
MQTTPTLAQTFTALATLAAITPREEAGDNPAHSVVYAYLNAPGHINVLAKNALLSVAHLPMGHPVFVVLHALHHAAYGGAPATTAQLVSSWWESDHY